MFLKKIEVTIFILMLSSVFLFAGQSKAWSYTQQSRENYVNNLKNETCAGQCPGYCDCNITNPETEKNVNIILYSDRKDFVLWSYYQAGTGESSNGITETGFLTVDIRNSEKNKKCQTYSKVVYDVQGSSIIDRLGFTATCSFQPEMRDYCCCQLTTVGKETKNYSCEVMKDYWGEEKQCRVKPGEVKEMPSDGNCSSLETQGTITTDNKTVVGLSTEELLTKAKQLNPMNFGNAQDVVGRIINAMLAFVGTIAFVFYLYAGFLWMTAAGSSERIESAKKIMLWTTLGLVMMFASYILVNFLFSDVVGNL